MFRNLTNDLLDLTATEVGFRHARAAVNIEVCCCSCCCDCFVCWPW